jgi:hypothetical protein
VRNTLGCRLRNYFGTAFYVKQNGEDTAVTNAIEAVSTDANVPCVRKLAVSMRYEHPDMHVKHA